MKYRTPFIVPVLLLAAAAMASLTLSSCAPANGSKDAAAPRDPSAPKVQGVNLNDPVQPVAFDGPIVLSAAKNEQTSIAIQVSNLPEMTPKRIFSVRIHPLKVKGSSADSGQIAPANYSAFQIL